MPNSTHFRALLVPLLAFVTTQALQAAEGGSTAPAVDVKNLAPIHGFTLPVFTEEGNRSMLLRGEEARLPSVDDIHIEGMDLTVFNKAKPELTESRLTATKARFDRLRQTASGEDHFLLKTTDATMTGLRWTYSQKPDGSNRKVTIDGEVSVLFNAQIGNLIQ